MFLTHARNEMKICLGGVYDISAPSTKAVNIDYGKCFKFKVSSHIPLFTLRCLLGKLSLRGSVITNKITWDSQKRTTWTTTYVNHHSRIKITISSFGEQPVP